MNNKIKLNSIKCSNVMLCMHIVSLIFVDIASRFNFIIHFFIFQNIFYSILFSFSFHYSVLILSLFYFRWFFLDNDRCMIETWK
jgi:hypothetical protein